VKEFDQAPLVEKLEAERMVGEFEMVLKLDPQLLKTFPQGSQH
jgi:hypothetical protein